MRINLNLGFDFNRGGSARADNVDSVMARTVVNRANWQRVQAEGIVNDAYVSRYHSYYHQDGRIGLPAKAFWLAAYTSGASLFQIRSSRHYSEENDFVGRYYELLASYVIGSGGMQVEADPMVEQAWSDWMSYADITGEQAGVPLMEEMLLHLARDGELMAYLVVDGGELRVHLLDVELVARGLTVHGQHIYDGVQYDQAMRPLGYYLRSGPISASGTALDTNRLQFIPADRVIRCYRRKFPGQTHGIPWLLSSVRSLDLLNDFDLAVMQRAKNSVPLLGYFETPLDYMTEEKAGAYESPIVEMNPNQVAERPEGTVFRRVDFSFPEQAYATYRRGMLTNAAAGSGVSYFSLASDLQGANYSSLRHGKIDDARYYGRVQTLFCAFLSRLFAAWVGHYSRSGATMSLRRRLDAQLMPAWTGPGDAYIDPVKEQDANESKLKNRLVAPSDLIRQMGQNPRAVFEKIKEDMKTMNDLGIPLPESLLPRAGADRRGADGR